MARAMELNTLLVQADLLLDVRTVESRRENESIIWLTRREETLRANLPKGDRFLQLPDSQMTSLAQVSLGLFLCVLNGYVKIDQTVICLSGVAGSTRLDMMMLANPRRDFPWFRRRHIKSSTAALKFVPAATFARALHIALRFAGEGREGKNIGTVLVITDPAEAKRHTRQLIFNPVKGHLKSLRSIHNPDFFETMRELAAIDGAFILSRRGTVESAGTYLDAHARKAKLPSGLGARHTAALALTKAIEAVAIVVSESSRMVTVYYSGKTIFELETPRLSSSP